jgi:rod shape-determining protein MreC
VVRRRAVVLALSFLSLALVTVYFRESDGGVLHGFQSTGAAILRPFEVGAERVASPFRDAAGWFGGLFDAKSENKKLKEEVERLRSELAQAETAVRDSGQLKGIAELHRQDYFPQSTQPVTARVIARSPTVWHSSVKIDKGTSDGVRVDQPVIAAGGLAGKVTSATGGTAEVRLITDGQSGVSAQVFPLGVTGVVRPEVGNPDDLLLENVESGRRVTENTLVITSGFKSSRLESLFPRGIPIGRVSKVDFDELETYQRVHIEPFADLRQLDIVQVLTRRGVSQEAAALPGAGG